MEIYESSRFDARTRFTKFSGLVWFRKTIDIPAGWAGKDLILNLGVIDDNDFTYFNGIQIGHTEGWMAPRSYKIPKRTCEEGKSGDCCTCNGYWWYWWYQWKS